MLSAGAVEGLLLGVGSEHAEDEGLAGSEAEVGQPLGNGLADVLVVVGLALDDAAEANDGVWVFLAVQHPGSGGQFEGAGHLHGVDVFWAGAVPEQRLVASLVEGVGDVRVPFGHYDAEGHFGRIGHGGGVVLGQVLQRRSHEGRYLLGNEPPEAIGHATNFLGGTLFFGRQEVVKCQGVVGFVVSEGKALLGARLVGFGHDDNIGGFFGGEAVVRDANAVGVVLVFAPLHDGTSGGEQQGVAAISFADGQHEAAEQVVVESHHEGAQPVGGIGCGFDEAIHSGVAFSTVEEGHVFLALRVVNEKDRLAFKGILQFQCVAVVFDGQFPGAGAVVADDAVGHIGQELESIGVGYMGVVHGSQDGAVLPRARAEVEVYPLTSEDGGAGLRAGKVLLGFGAAIVLLAGAERKGCEKSQEENLSHR